MYWPRRHYLVAPILSLAADEVRLSSTGQVWTLLSLDSTRQLTYLKERGSTERFCRGPGADAVTTASQAVSAQVPLTGSSVGLGEESTNGAADLGAWNPAVLIARELMCRACELASNINADAATEL